MNLTMPSRDSRVWWFGIISSVIVAAAANLNLFPWFPDHVKHTLSIAAFIIGVTSGKMANSPRPSKEEQKQDAVIDDALSTIRRVK